MFHSGRISRRRVARLIPALLAGYEAAGVIEKDLCRPGDARRLPLHRHLRPHRRRRSGPADGAERQADGVGGQRRLLRRLLQSFADGTDEWRYQVGVVGLRVQPDAVTGRARAARSGSPARRAR